MSRQQEILRENVINQMRKMINLLQAGAIIKQNAIIMHKNVFGLEIKVQYDEKMKTRAKILFSTDDN